MSRQGSSLVVSPVSLKFKFIPNQPLFAKISLHNPTKDRVAFSIVPNQRDRYYIENKTGYVNSGETFHVDVYMHASSELPIDLTQDKFIVEFAQVYQGMFVRVNPLLIADLPPTKKIEVGVVLKQQATDKAKIEYNTYQFWESYRKLVVRNESSTERPQSRREERKDLFTQRLHSNGKNSTNLGIVQNEEKYLHEGKLIRGTEVSGKFQLKPQKIKSNGEVSLTESNRINGENQKKRDYRKIKSQGSIRERLKSGSEFISDVLQKDLTSGRVFLTFPLDLLFPRAIRAYTAQICQIILGLIIFFSFLTYFIWLFLQFKECKISDIQTAEVPDNKISCIPKFIDINVLSSLSVDGFWDGDQNYVVRDAGPWQFRFVAYQADNETFLSNIDNLVLKANTFVQSLQTKTYKENLGAALFFSAKENGQNGTVEITANIDLEMVFDNYYYKQFSFINFKYQLLKSVNQSQSAKIGDDQKLPPLRYLQNCRGKLTPVGDEYNCENVAKGTLETTNGLGDLTYIAPSVSYYNIFKDYYNIFGEKFFENVDEYQKIAKQILDNPTFNTTDAFNRTVSMHDMLAYPEKPFQSKFNIQEAFIFDYCNNIGREQCMLIFNESYGKDDFVYTWTPGFFNYLGSDIHELQGMGHRPGVAKYEAYINNLDMFGIFSGKNNIVLTSNGGPNTDYALIFVPELVQHDLQDGEMVCRYCQEPGLHDTTDCQENLYIILHQYAFPISEYEKYYNFTMYETVENFYVTSFIHGLESWVGYYRNRAGIHTESQNPDFSSKKNYGIHQKNQNYGYFYNQDFSSVNDLHCDGSQKWAFKDNLKIKVPFLLETGIFSCKIKDCPQVLDVIARVWANVELAFLVVNLILSIVILLVLFIMHGGKKDTQEGAVSVRETLAAVTDHA